MVRPAVQGTDRLWHRGLLERYERACAVYSPERLKAFFESMDELSRKDNIVQDEFFGKVVGGALG